MKKFIFLLSCLAVCIGAQASSVKGFWDFDEGIIDQAPYSILTTGHDLGIVGGKFGRAILLNGATSYVRAADNQALKFGAGSFSLSAWVRPTSAGVFSFILNKRGTGPYGENPGVILGVMDVSGGFALSAVVDDGEGNFVACEGCGDTFSYGSWYQVSLVYAGDNLKLYVNGQVDSQTPGPALGSINNNHALYIGGNTVHSGGEGVISNQFNGVLDEVKVFDNVLQDSDVLASYESDNESNYSTRIGAYRHENAPGEIYSRDTVYQAPYDGAVTVYLGGSRCERNYAVVRVGSTADNLDQVGGRINGFNSATAIVANGEYFNIDHYRKYSSCKPTITFRPIF